MFPVVQRTTHVAGGAGGKGTWGRLGSELEVPADDRKDPNYDSDSQDDLKFERIIPALAEEDFEKEVEPVLREYLENGDPQEVAQTLEELNLGPLRSRLVVLAVSMALERKPSHREMTSEHLAAGFQTLLAALPDLVLDTPEAPVALGNFLARAVADDCLPPRFVEDSLEAAEPGLTHTALDHAATLLHMRHGLVRLDNVWGVGGGILPVKCLVRQIRLLLQEYLSSGDVAEATRCLRDLEVPHFHHELIYEGVVMTLEDTRVRTMELMAKFLAELALTLVVTPDQLRHGFFRVYEEMGEISLDVPAAYVLLEKFVTMCHQAGFLPSELVKSLPSRGRKRFVSEGDGGRIKDC
ncbi:PDCD4 [Cordylochernes scorpioides]|uniref:PDCD4 n=1 Tax=Cordylochernes scorpioides TaxID=51811 RepID=A0ABY6L6N8_9ARAC|nr:PDCD4 [Cordylochernes scorpioides]